MYFSPQLFLLATLATVPAVLGAPIYSTAVNATTFHTTAIAPTPTSTNITTTSFDYMIATVPNPTAEPTTVDLEVEASGDHLETTQRIDHGIAGMSTTAFIALVVCLSGAVFLVFCVFCVACHPSRWPLLLFSDSLPFLVRVMPGR